MQQVEEDKEDVEMVNYNESKKDEAPDIMQQSQNMVKVLQILKEYFQVIIPS